MGEGNRSNSSDLLHVFDQMFYPFFLNYLQFQQLTVSIPKELTAMNRTYIRSITSMAFFFFNDSLATFHKYFLPCILCN